MEGCAVSCSTKSGRPLTFVIASSPALKSEGWLDGVHFEPGPNGKPSLEGFLWAEPCAVRVKKKHLYATFVRAGFSCKMR